MTMAAKEKHFAGGRGTLGQVLEALAEDRLIVKIGRRGWFLGRWAKHSREEPVLFGDGEWLLRLNAGPSNRNFFITNIEDEGREWKIINGRNS